MRVDEVRAVDHEIPPGVWPDMTGHGYERDDFPAIYRELVAPADIVILAGPVWLGDQSSQTRKIVERLYAYSGEVNAAGRWCYSLGGRGGPRPVIHARALKDAGGIPAHGNSTFDWDLTQPGHPNPEYRAPAASASR